jgi:transporter family protein
MLKQGFLFAVLAASVWGLAPLFAKVGLVKTDPLAGVAVRSIAVTVVVLATIIVTGQQRALLTTEPRALLVLAIEGFLGGLIGQYFYFRAIKSLGASTVAPIVGSYPLFTFVFALLILGEKITLTKGVGAILAVSGIILLGM